MSVERNFAKLVKRFAAVEQGGESGPPYPFGIPPTVQELSAVIEKGASAIPLVFRKQYADPLVTNLASVLQMTAGDHVAVETLAGAIYQHSQAELVPSLRRFLAVISDIFRSFLSEKRRTAADFPVLQSIPPLATFQRSGSMGPFTYTCSDIARYTGGQVGVVSLPAIYKEHPILWSTLAHETGGHDVIHADAALLPEMQLGAKSLFGDTASTSKTGLNRKQVLGLIWSYWMEEASADAFAVLNMGPVFAINAAAFCSALLFDCKDKKAIPTLRTESIFDAHDPEKTFETHPTDVLRLSLLAGVIDSLANLEPGTRETYLKQLRAIEQSCVPNTTVIKLKGVINADGGVRHEIDLSIPIEEMQEAAHKVGVYIVTTRFKALGGKSIQELETWCDFDESVALKMRDLLAEGKAASTYGDDAHLLAAANLAVLAKPDSYAAVTLALEKSLDHSFQTDPYWSAIRPAKARGRAARKN